MLELISKFFLTFHGKLYKKIIAGLTPTSCNSLQWPEESGKYTSPTNVQRKAYLFMPTLGPIRDLARVGHVKPYVQRGRPTDIGL